VIPKRTLRSCTSYARFTKKRGDEPMTATADAKSVVQSFYSSLAAGKPEAEEPPIHALLGSSITYRIATGPREGQKVFTLQTLPAAMNAPASPCTPASPRRPRNVTRSSTWRATSQGPRSPPTAWR
jgi:hypothetical protein